MAVYEVGIADGFEWVLPMTKADQGLIRELYDGMPTTPWGPAKVRFLREDEGTRLVECDFPCLASQVLVMRTNAREVVADILEGQGLFLVIEERYGTILQAFVPQLVDALDVGRSDVVRSPDDGRILVVLRPNFVRDRIAGLRAWRLPYTSSPVFVGDEFVQRIKSHGLRGLAFKQVDS